MRARQLWAIMLRNGSDVFTAQCSSRKFLDTLEDVLASSKTSPVVRERLLEVLAGAAFMSPSGTSRAPPSRAVLTPPAGGKHDKEGFRGLWRKVRAPEQPEEVRVCARAVGMATDGAGPRAYRLTRTTPCSSRRASTSRPRRCADPPSRDAPR